MKHFENMSDEFILQQINNWGFISKEDVLVEIMREDNTENKLKWLQSCYAKLEYMETKKPSA